MSQLLEQHNKLIENLRKRDEIIQKSLGSINDRFGHHHHTINVNTSNIQQLHEDQVTMVARIVGYEGKACHCGDGSDHLSDLSYGEPVATSSSHSFPDCLTSSPLPIPAPVPHVTGHTGDKPLFTGPVLVEYIVAPCPMYQHFPGQEQVGFFQNVPNDVTSTSQLSTLWEHLKSTGPCDQSVPNQ